MAGIHFDITGDNTNFLRKLQEVENGVKSTSKQIEQSGLGIEDLFNRMTQAAAAFGAGFTVKELISNIVQVRGEFQQLEVAFNTMLGSSEKANVLMQQLVKTAATTPFDLQGVANGAKQLLAYGEDVEKVNDDLIRLGNIAAGLSQPLGDIVYLYGTTMTQGRLYTQDLNQFTGRGIPMIRELAKQFGVAENEVKGLVEAGKVGFPEVQKVIMSLTDEGGMFFNLMQEQSKTITGQISNIEDAIATMFNEIGKANEGVINDALSGVSYLVENYEKVGREIMAVVSAYGAYKAVLMSVAAYQSSVAGLTYATEIAELSKLIPEKEKSINTDLAAAVASGKLTQERANEVAAIRAQIAALVTKAEIEQKSAIAAVAAAQKEFDISKERLQAAQDAIDGIDDWIARAEDLGDTELANAYRTKLAEKSTELQTAATQHNTAAKALNEAKTKEKIATETAETLKTNVNTASTVANTKATNILTLAKEKLSAASKALGLSLLANPYVLVASAIAGLTYGIYKLVTAETASEKAVREHREEQEKFQKAIDERKSKIEDLIRIVQDETETEYAQIKAYEELQKLSPALTESYSREELAVASLAETNKRLNKERDQQNYDHIISEIERLTKAMKTYQQQSGLSGNALENKSDYKALKKQIELLEGELYQYNRLKKEAEEDAKPVEVKLLEAKSSREQIVQEYNAAKLALKQEQEKLAESSFSVIPIDVQIRFNKAKEELSNIDNVISKLENKQSNTDKTYAQAYKEAKDNWKAKTKAVQEAKKKSEAEYKKAVEEQEEAEKAYKDLGGVTGSSLTKQESQAKKEAEERLKQQEQLAEQLLSLRRKNQQDEINLMVEGAEKKLAQIDLDYQKELDTIEKQREEWKKAQKGKLTDEQETQLSASEENAFEAYQKSVDEVNKTKLESDRKAWQEYFIEFGNYQEKRKNLIQKYDDEIAKLQSDSPEYAIKVAEKDQAIEQLDEQYGKSTKAMADLFEDASNKSVSAIQSIIDKYETLVEYLSGESDVTIDLLKELGFTDKDIEKIEKGEISIKDVTDAIKGLKDELKGKSPWQSFVADLGKGIKLIKEAGGDTKKIGQGITDIGSSVTSFAPALSAFGSNIANIFGFDDSKITGAIDALGGLGQTAAGVGQIMSGDIVGGAMSAVSGISSVVSALDGMFGADYSRYNKMVEEYNQLNEIWDELIDKKLEYIGISYGSEANKVGKEALELAEKSIESYRILGKERLNSGASIGSHSIGVKMRKRMSKEGWNELRDAAKSIGFDYSSVAEGRMTGLFDLTAEQLDKLKQEAPTFWAKMDGDVREYLDSIIEGGERIQDIQNQVKEQLTQVSFDSVFDSFVDMLMDMDSSAEDFSKNFEQYMQRAILTTMVGNKYRDKLQAWYDSFAKANDDKAGITKEEMERSQAEWDAIVAEALAEREALKNIMGWTGSSSQQQGATAGGFETMSQDTATELNGRFTALQIAGEEIKNQMQNAAAGINSLVAISTDGNTVMNNILNQHVITNGYLEDIVKYTKPMLDFGTKFDKMISIFNEKL